MKGSTILLVGGLLVGGYILWNTVIKSWAIDKAGGIAQRYNTDPVFRKQFQNAVAPITQKKANYTYY
jgi:hypothetical protein